MKILVAHTFYQIKGGEDTVFVNEVDLLSSAFEIKDVRFDNTGSKVNVICKYLLSPFNIVVYFRFIKLLNKEKPDIVHVHNWHFAASPLIFWAARKRGIPVVHTLHNYRLLCPSATLFANQEIFTDSLSQSFPWNAIYKKVYRDSFFHTFWLASTIWLHKKLKTWKNITRFITLTPFAKAIFVQSNLGIAENRITVKPNFVKDYGYNLGDRGDHFLYVGRLAEEKGVKCLLEAFSQTNTKLVIIGDGPLKCLVEDVQANNSNISFLGVLPNAEINKHMKEASALIFPSIWFEGMPMTILEAFSTGTPVLATKLGAMESMITDGYNGLLFSPANVNELLERLEYWQRLSKIRKKEIAYNSRQLYDKLYTPERNLEQMISIYSEIKYSQIHQSKRI